MEKFEELERLKRLKDAGALTEIEYEIEKSKVLNGDNITKDTNDDSNKCSQNATIGLILGLCSIIAWFIPLIGFPVTIIGIIFSAKGLNSYNKGKAIAGLVLSIVFLVATLINSISGAILTSLLYY